MLTISVTTNIILFFLAVGITGRDLVGLIFLIGIVIHGMIGTVKNDGESPNPLLYFFSVQDFLA
jgi:hypothetical protein